MKLKQLKEEIERLKAIHIPPLKENYQEFKLQGIKQVVEAVDKTKSLIFIGNDKVENEDYKLWIEIKELLNLNKG